MKERENLEQESEKLNLLRIRERKDRKPYGERLRKSRLA